MRGAGKQLFGALGIILSYYFVGFPIGVSLMFAAKMGIIGECPHRYGGRIITDPESN